MSTVTLSNPHCAITSAENPDGIASQAFTTALPEAHTFLTLFAIGRISLFIVCCGQSISLNGPSGQLTARWMLTSLTPTSRAVFTIAAQVSSGKGTPFFGAVGAHFPFGIAGDQHSVNAGDRFSRPDKVDVARDFAVEEIAGIDHFGIDINSEHAVGEAPVRPGCTGAGQRAAEQFADEGQTRALVLAEGADRALALTVVARTLRGVRSVQHRRIFAQVAIEIDQRALRQFLAAAARDQ